MDSFNLRIINYRNLSPPINIEIKEGITFILGLNNVGKSNLLKFFFETRELIKLSNQQIDNEYISGITGDPFLINILNRNLEKEFLIFELTNDKTSIKVDVRPVSESNFNNVSIKTTIELGSHEDAKILVDRFRNTLYVGASRVIQNQTGQSYFDINTGTTFFEQWSRWAGGSDFKKMAKIKELIEELKQLFGFDRFDVKINDAKNNLLITTDDGDFFLDELGNGLAHIIIVLGNALMRKPEFILIDEPEIGLHPKMQQLFIHALASKATSGLIATSHSIGLAKSVADNIHFLIKEVSGQVKFSNYSKTSSLSQLLGELSYSQYNELGGDKILLVEGRTDIKSFKEILNKFKLESQFIIISFGGRQFMTTDKNKISEELYELKRLNTKVFVIFDSEKESETSVLKPEFSCFKEVCEDLGFIVFSTEFHSTENYIKQKSIDKLNLNLKQLMPFEKNNNWPKEKNWLMFKGMTKEDFNGTSLKDFIETKMI